MVLIKNMMNFHYFRIQKSFKGSITRRYTFVAVRTQITKFKFLAIVFNNPY